MDSPEISPEPEPDEYDSADDSDMVRDNYDGEYIPRYRTCSECGGTETWCSSCECYSKTCCQDWGSCMCS
jgi:hypothetical protein